MSSKGTLLILGIAVGFTLLYLFILSPLLERKFKQRLITKGLFKEVEKIGFVRHEEKMKATYKGYLVTLYSVWSGAFEKVIGIHFEYTPHATTREEITATNQRRQRKYNNKYSWFLHQMTLPLCFRFKPPTQAAIIATLDEMLAVLEAEGFQPISERQSLKEFDKYDHWQALLN